MYKKESKMFIDAIKTISTKENNLDNLEIYLSIHFEKWMQKFANTPAGLAYELKIFADMEV